MVPRRWQPGKRWLLAAFYCLLPQVRWSISAQYAQCKFVHQQQANVDGERTKLENRQKSELIELKECN